MSNENNKEMKTSRGKNFTQREKSLMLSIVEKYKNVLENKTTNAAMISKKKQMWETVASEFNSCSEFLRSTQQLQTAYGNLKRLTRKNVADQNMHNYLQRCQNPMSEVLATIEISSQPPLPLQCNDPMPDRKTMEVVDMVDDNKLKELFLKFKKDEAVDKKAIKATGGGSYQPQLTDVGAQILAIMGDQIEPLHNNCESASSYYGQNSEQSTNKMAITTNKENIHKTNKELNDEPKSSFMVDSHVESSDNVNVKNIQRKRTSHTVTSGRKRQQLKQKKTHEDLRSHYYQKKLASAIIEKKTRLLEYKLILKKHQILDLEIEIKKKTLDNMI